MQRSDSADEVLSDSGHLDGWGYVFGFGLEEVIFEEIPRGFPYVVWGEKQRK